MFHKYIHLYSKKFIHVIFKNMMAGGELGDGLSSLTDGGLNLLLLCWARWEASHATLSIRSRTNKDGSCQLSASQLYSDSSESPLRTGFSSCCTGPGRRPHLPPSQTDREQLTENAHWLPGDPSDQMDLLQNAIDEHVKKFPVGLFDGLASFFILSGFLADLETAAGAWRRGHWSSWVALS